MKKIGFVFLMVFCLLTITQVNIHLLAADDDPCGVRLTAWDHKTKTGWSLNSGFYTYCDPNYPYYFCCFMVTPE